MYKDSVTYLLKRVYYKVCKYLFKIRFKIVFGLYKENRVMFILEQCFIHRNTNN